MSPLIVNKIARDGLFVNLESERRDKDKEQILRFAPKEQNCFEFKSDG